jgi:folate-binding protein YgfZ
MLSNDVKTLPEGAGIEATFLTNKGKLVSDLVVYKEPERLCLELQRERVDVLMPALDRYVISEDVKLESLADAEARVSVEGPEAASVLAEATNAPAETLRGLEDLHFLSTLSGEVPLVLIARRREPSARFDVLAPLDGAEAVLSRILDRGAVAAGDDAAETRRLEAGRPRFGVDMDDSHLPLEAGLDRAISYEKGCYIGQEYVVRLAHRGHVNRKLLGIRVEGDTPPARGSRVLLEASGSDVGEVTSARYSPAAGAGLALAYLRREAFEPGTRVVVVSGDERRPGSVSSLPFLSS